MPRIAVYLAYGRLVVVVSASASLNTVYSALHSVSVYLYLNKISASSESDSTRQRQHLCLQFQCGAKCTRLPLALTIACPVTIAPC